MKNLSKRHCQLQVSRGQAVNDVLIHGRPGQLRCHCRHWFDMAESTACGVIRNLLQVIAYHMLSKLATWPTAEESQEMRELHEAPHWFPGVVGMIRRHTHRHSNAC